MVPEQLLALADAIRANAAAVKTAAAAEAVDLRFPASNAANLGGGTRREVSLVFAYEAQAKAFIEALQAAVRPAPVAAPSTLDGAKFTSM